MSISTNTRTNKTKQLVMVALFIALAFACQFVFRIKVSFLTFDAKDAVITIGAMFFGPVSGCAMALVVSLLELISVSDTGIWGFIMNFASTAVFACVASAIYKYAPRIKKTMTGSIVGLLSSVLSMTVVMIIMNLFITPIYTGAPRSQIIAMIPTLLLPFNLTKALMNAALVLVLYKPISVALRRSRIIDHGPTDYKFNKLTVLVTVVGLALIVACVVVFMIALNGHFQLTK